MPSSYRETKACTCLATVPCLFSTLAHTCGVNCGYFIRENGTQLEALELNDYLPTATHSITDCFLSLVLVI